MAFISLNPTPYTLHPTPYTLNPKPLPSRADKGMAFMSPKFRDINAANDKSAPCFPASAPICITIDD